MDTSALDRLFHQLDVNVEAIALCEVPDGLRLQAPAQDAVIVHYVLSGTLCLEGDGGERLVCPAGSVVIVPAGLSKAISSDAVACRTALAADHIRTGPDGLLILDAADGRQGDVRFACGVVAVGHPGAIALLCARGGAAAEDLSHIPFVREAFAMILRETVAGEPGARALTGALMKSCLMLVMRAQFARCRDPWALALHDPKIGKALSAVLDEPAGAHSVASLAAAAGMCRSAFAKSFTEIMEVTPMTFVTETRIARAAHLLRSTQMPVKAVASAVGFASRSHFSRAFRDTQGVDPSEYRRPAESVSA